MMTAIGKDSASAEPTRFEFCSLQDIDDPLLRTGIAYWEKLRGGRAFPAREQIGPRAIAPLLSRTVLIKVLEDGADFEYVVVGDEVARAYKAKLIHRRISDIAREMPNNIDFWGGVYRQICKDHKPVAVRIVAGHDGETHFSEGTVVLLPLGSSDERVDHMITFGRRRLTKA
jgi:hypothetical protein